MGCAATPPPRVEDCAPRHPVFVISHGRHTGLGLAAADLLARVPGLAAQLDEAGFLEIGWGEAQFYQASQVGWLDALRALGWPNPSVLQVVALPVAPARYFPLSEVVAIQPGPQAYERLLQFVAASFQRGEAGMPIRLGPALYGRGWFYAAKGRFHAFNTCNTWVAAALEGAGYRLSGRRIVTATGLLAALRRQPAAAGCRLGGHPGRSSMAGAAQPGAVESQLRTAPGSSSTAVPPLPRPAPRQPCGAVR